MKTETIYTTSRAHAIACMPWASKIKKVDGGYRGWESIADYEIWKNQK